MNKAKINKNYLALIPFVLIVVCYELVPLSQLIFNSFLNQKTGGLSLDNFTRIFTTPLYQTAIWNSVRISLVSAVTGIVIAFIGAKACCDSGRRQKSIFTMVLNMTSNFSGVPLTFAFMILMGNTGVFTLIGKELGISWLAGFNLYGGSGLMMIYIYFQIPLATLLLMPAFLGLKKEWKEAATILHANSFRYWFKIGIPNLLPALLGTVGVLFSNALAAYATAYALIVNNYALLALQISSKFKGEVRIDRQMGGALAVVLIVLMLLATMVNNYLTKRNTKGRVLV